MCAVDQKRSFFPRAVPFLDLLPFEGPFPAYRGPYGQTALQKAPYELQESLREATGRNFTRIEREFPLVCRRPKKAVFPRAVLFLDLLPFKGPFPLTGALTGKPPYGKAPYGLTNYRKAYGKLRGGTLPELGGNFRLCAVDQKRSFFPRVGPFLDLLPVKGPFPLTGALTGRPPYGKVPYGPLPFQGPCPLTGALTGKPPYGKAPYGEASYEKAPYELQESLRGNYGEGFYQNWAGISACAP